MSYENISKLRKILVEEFSIYEGEPVLLTFDNKLLKKIFFEGHEFSNEIKSILPKIDFSNISFDGYNCYSKDFSKFTGVKINPQKSYEKNLGNSIYRNVEFIGSFDGVKIMGSMFGGSEGAVINPQTIPDKNLAFGEYENVTFNGDFDGVNIEATKFEGSNYADLIAYEENFRSEIKSMIIKKVINL